MDTSEDMVRLLQGDCLQLPETCSDEQLVGDVRQTEAMVRVALSRQLSMIAEVERRGLHTRDGARNVKSWLQNLVRISGSDAHTRATLARKVDHLSTSVGASVKLPETAEALNEGAIGLDHARAISDGVRRLEPVTTSAEQAEAEEFLAGQARILGPREVRVLADRLQYQMDQDGACQDEERQIASRELHLGVGRDGMTTINGQLDREAGAALRVALDPLAKPRPGDGEPDSRSAAKRNADALIELLDRTLAHERIPVTGGERPRIAVTVNLDDLADRIGGGTLDITGEPLSAGAIRRIACDSEVIPVVLGSSSEPLDIGRGDYTVPLHLRRALHIRDGSCAFPGCDHPFGTSHAHHCRHWAEGGETKIDNLVMLCAAHHRLLHAQAWRSQINHHGLPEFIPPRGVDPEQAPRSHDPATWLPVPA